MTFQPRARRRGARAVASAAFVSLAITTPLAIAQPAPDEYQLLDHVQGTSVLTNAAPVRPMIIDSATDIWAINTGLGTLERFRGTNTGPIDVRQVPWGPVALAEWADPDGTPELLIVCRNTWGLLRMDKASGQYQGFIRLPAEPTDVVIDNENRAFVSCQGADAVVRVDLTIRDGNFHELYDETSTLGKLRLKSPYFLAKDTDGTVLVTPLHSGNNTVVPGLPLADIDQVVSLNGLAAGLPDEDLFRIDGSLPAGNPNAIEVVATGVGSILFGHGRHPIDGKYWLLNTEALNADPARQSEPDLQGHFVDNRVTILNATHTTGPAGPGIRFEMDDPAFDDDEVIGQPFAIAFHPTNGRALVAGLLTDNVTVFDQNGGRLFEIDLPEGSIPRGIVPFPSHPRFVAVYCWGTGKIEVYRINYANQSSFHSGTYQLSPDPITADPALTLGRKLFFDGDVSARGNVSCASCHVDAGTDFLTWNLSGAPFDDKGPMVTQTLVGLERVSPFHWRGERTMEDFNTLAFPNLLGADKPLDPADFAAMKAWLFALKNPANPFQTDTRRIDGTLAFESKVPTGLPANHPFVTTSGQTPLTFIGGDAIVGQTSFLTEHVFQNRFACADCHALPIGTNNDIFATGDGADRPGRSHFVNTPFHELWRKKQSMVLIDFAAPGGSPDPEVRTFLGTGLSHSGSAGDIVRFTQPALDPGDDPQFLLDVATFMQQLDQGLAPAAHYARLLPAGPPGGSAYQELASYLLGQASTTANSDGVPNCDVAVLRTTAPRRGWFLQRPAGATTITASDPVFVSSLDAEPARSLDQFDASEPAYLFIGLPVGMAERFAVDFDMDGVKNEDEADNNLFTVNIDPNDVTPPDPSISAGYLSTNTARVFIETDEPSTVAIEWFESGTGDRMRVESNLLSRVHTFITADMRPSTLAAADPPDVPFAIVSYDADVFATDAHGNSLTSPISFSPAVPVTGAFTMPPDPMGQPENGVPFEQVLHEHVLAGPPVVNLGSPSGGSVAGSVDMTAVYKQGTGQPASGRGFAVRLFSSSDGVAPFEPIPEIRITPGVGALLVDGAFVRPSTGPANLLSIDGPLLLNDTPTGPTGSVSLAFSLAGPFTPGEVILANVEAIVETTSIRVLCPAAGCFGEWTVADHAALAQWDVPRTTEALLNGSAVVPP